MFSAQLSQVFEEKNALSLQLRGSGRGGESRQHRSEVLARRLLLEGKLREPQPADKGTVRAGVGEENLTAEGCAGCAALQLLCLCSVQPALHSCLFQELFATDAAPGAPQEKNEPRSGSYTPELQELQLR